MSESQGNDGESLRGSMPEWQQRLFHWIDDNAFVTLFAVVSIGLRQDVSPAYCTFGLPFVVGTERAVRATGEFATFWQQQLRSDVAAKLSDHTRSLNASITGCGLETVGDILLFHVQLYNINRMNQPSEEVAMEWYRYMVGVMRAFCVKHLA